MNAGVAVIHTVALFFGIFLGLFGLSLWIAGFANPRTDAFRQTALATASGTAAILLLAYAFTGSLPY